MNEINPNSDYLIDTAVLSAAQADAIVIAVDQYRASETLPARAEDIADWAIERGLWPDLWPNSSLEGEVDPIFEPAEVVETVLRNATHMDPQGRIVNTWLATPYEVDGETVWLWDDVRTAGHEHMRAGIAAWSTAIKSRMGGRT